MLSREELANRVAAEPCLMYQAEPVCSKHLSAAVADIVFEMTDE